MNTLINYIWNTNTVLSYYFQVPGEAAAVRMVAEAGTQYIQPRHSEAEPSRRQSHQYCNRSHSPPRHAESVNREIGLLKIGNNDNPENSNLRPVL